jgi:thiol-disulfide isomerase/thioredoxin
MVSTSASAGKGPRRAFERRCGHCKHLKPEFASAAKRLAGTVNFANVDATKERDLAVRFSVVGYPTLFHIKDGEVREASGAGRSAESLVRFAASGWKKQEPMPYWTSPASPM